MFHYDGIDLQAAHDEQQSVYDLTFLNSASPSRFFACKQVTCFHKFVMQVLPPNYGHCSSQYYAALHCVGLVCCVCVFNVLQIKVS